MLLDIDGPVAVVPAAVLAALFGAHGPAFDAPRLRAAVLGPPGRPGEARTFALTAVGGGAKRAGVSRSAA